MAFAERTVGSTDGLFASIVLYVATQIERQSCLKWRLPAWLELGCLSLPPSSHLNWPILVGGSIVMALRRKTAAAICRPAVALLEPVLAMPGCFSWAQAVCLLSAGAASISCSFPDSSIVLGATYAGPVHLTVKLLQAH